ncbi:MAG TPA: hypothetical protein GXZ87_10560 [Bacteroidales bacterium]|nr:hypothetical protein [Bacteroidales bacterium]
MKFTEAIKIKNGKIHNLRYHQSRVDRTVDAFGLKKINLSEALAEIPNAAKKGLIKCRVLYGKKIESIEFTPYQFQQRKRVALVSAGDLDYQFKYADRENLNAFHQKDKFDDIIFIKNGFVTDSLSANLVFENENGLFTPKTYLLAGTKRALLLEKGIIQEVDISKNDITFYQKIRFINAMMDLEDGIAIDVSEVVL